MTYSIEKNSVVRALRRWLAALASEPIRITVSPRWARILRALGARR